MGVSLLTAGSPSQGKLVCIGGKSQRVLWEYRAEAAIESTPVLGDDGLLYFGDNHGRLHAIDAEGKCVWKADVGSPIRSAGNIAPGRVLFGTDRGSLAAIACSSQSVARRGWPKHMGGSR